MGIAFGGVMSLSSCWAIPAYIIAHDAAVIQANATRDAARINANSQRNQQNIYEAPSARKNSYIYSAFTKFEDLDGNSNVSNGEIKGEKETFCVNEPFIVGLFSENPIVGLSYRLMKNGEAIDCRDNSNKNIAIKSSVD